MQKVNVPYIFLIMILPVNLIQAEETIDVGKTKIKFT